MFLLAVYSLFLLSIFSLFLSAVFTLTVFVAVFSLFLLAILEVSCYFVGHLLLISVGNLLAVFIRRLLAVFIGRLLAVFVSHFLFLTAVLVPVLIGCSSHLFFIHCFNSFSFGSFKLLYSGSPFPITRSYLSEYELLKVRVGSIKRYFNGMETIFGR